MTSGTINGSRFIRAMGAPFRLREDGSVSAACTLGEAQEGAPGYAHGGALAALIDEAMGAACWLTGYRAVSVHLSFDYQYPVALGAPIHVSGQVERRDGRKVFTSGSIRLADGNVAVSGSGIFVDAPAMLEKVTGFSLSLDE